MKNLLYKEFRLAIHPSVYIFFVLTALLLVPSYPYYVSFFYLMLGIFLTFKTNRAENDIFYSALLPVRKGDVVRARVLTVALLELANILIAIPFAVISAKINPAGGNNAGIEPNVAFFGLSFLMYGGFNLIFFPVFYKTGRSEGKAFLWGGVFTFLYIIAAESLAQYIPSPVSAYLDTLEKSAQLRQLPVLFAGIILWAAFTLLSAKISAESRNARKIASPPRRGMGTLCIRRLSFGTSQILRGEIAPGEVLPPIRTVAQELSVSLISVRRAWEELERDGFIHTAVGRGTFAAALGETDKAAMRRAILKEKLTDAAQFCAAVGASGEEAAALLRELMKEENA